eukprot:m.1655518 g.1655518  ORF g.1655518 m.1655518 type:complete len:60 (-) comp104609_c0_seq1:118-297(-)
MLRHGTTGTLLSVVLPYNFSGNLLPAAPNTVSVNTLCGTTFCFDCLHVGTTHCGGGCLK